MSGLASTASGPGSGRILEAVQTAMGLPTEAAAAAGRGEVDRAVAAIVHKVAEVHQRDLDATHDELCESFGAHRRLPAEHAEVMSAVADALVPDHEAHGRALDRLEAGLRDAVRLPSADRERAVHGLLDAERHRVKRQAQTRVARASRRLPMVRQLTDAELGYA